MRLKFWYLALWCAVVIPNAAQSRPAPLELKPSSRWQVDYAEERCRLGRKFGTGNDEIMVFFDRSAPEDFFRLILAGKPARAPANEVEAIAQFGPFEPEQKILSYQGSFGPNVPALIFGGKMRIAPATDEERERVKIAKFNEPISWSPLPPSKAASVKYLKIGRPLNRDVILFTGPMTAPLAALDACMDNLMINWGVDVEKHKTLKRKVIPTSPPGDWLSSNDYPLKMLNEGQSSIVDFRLIVGIDGIPTECRIQLTTRPKEFDEAVCKSIMRHARFEPALDAEGIPIVSYWAQTVRFQYSSTYPIF